MLKVVSTLTYMLYYVYLGYVYGRFMRALIANNNGTIEEHEKQKRQYYD